MKMWETAFSTCTSVTSGLPREGVLSSLLLLLFTADFIGYLE